MQYDIFLVVAAFGVLVAMAQEKTPAIPTPTIPPTPPAAGIAAGRHDLHDDPHRERFNDPHQGLRRAHRYERVYRGVRTVDAHRVRRRG